MAVPVTLEICVDSADSAVAAQEGGAHRVELCSHLDVGGTTPGPETIFRTRRSITIPMHVMIRPRGGNFCYSADEIESMKKAIASAKEMFADGVVFGVLRSDGSVDAEETARLVALARPMSVTFHRAFDEASDPMQALEALASAGIDRLLTSGQQPTAMEGAGLIGQLVARSRGRVAIMAGAGIGAGNAGDIIRKTGVNEIHVARAALGHYGVTVEANKVRTILEEATLALTKQ
jgi:copper homeostasis protein